MFICKNGHSFPTTDSNTTQVVECPTCGEKLLEIESSDGTGTLLDSYLPSSIEKPIFSEQSNSIDNTLVPNSVDEEPDSKLLATQNLQGTLLDSLLLKPESIDNTLVPNSVDEEPNSNLLATQNLQGTLLDSLLLKPESISYTQSKPDAASNTNTVDVQKTEAINNPDATLEMGPGTDTRIQKKPNLNNPTNQNSGTEPGEHQATLEMGPGTDTRIQKKPNLNNPTNQNFGIDTGGPQATLDMVPGTDTRVQKQPNFDTSTKPLTNPALEKTGVHQNVKIVSGSQTNPVPKSKSTIRKIVAKAPEGYEIVGELGRGAMGVVYKARQTGLKRLVALKMILSAGRASKIEIARFRIEAEAVAKLDHPNIVKIYEIGEIDNLPFFSLEFVSGGVLSSRIKNNIPTARQAAIMMRGIAEGMDFAHRKGIVHRDLKPANILLSPPDQAGEDVDF